MRYSQLYSNSLNQFKEKDKSLDIQLLLEKAFALTREQFWVKKNREITDTRGLKTFYRYRKRLLDQEPVAYILRKKEFYGETFFVDKNVLIPRPETEILVDQAIALISGPAKVLDIGAGSGNIAITLAKKTGAEVTAVEKSSKAYRVLRKNIALHGVAEKVTALQGDLFPTGIFRFDLIVSNPPYIPEAEWQELAPNVRDYEPKEALAAGEDGLLIIRQIAAAAGSSLKPGGYLLLEIGYNQKEPVMHILTDAQFTDIRFFNDYSGIPRVVCASGGQGALFDEALYRHPAPRGPLAVRGNRRKNNDR